MLTRMLTESKYFQYIPVHEVSSDEEHKVNGVKIWDILGEYESQNRTVIIYDRLVNEEAKRLNPNEFSSKILADTSTIELHLREIVRLHEHAHAFLHTAVIKDENLPPYSHEWYRSLSKDVNEPLTEFLTYCVVREGREAFTEVFEEVNPGPGSIYENYKKIEEILGKGKAYYSIAPLVKFARTKAWKNWSDFKHALEKKRTGNRM